MPLTAARIRSAEPAERPYKLADGLGLFLFVAPSGLRSWRMAFRYQGKEQLLTFGRFPELGLGEARARRDDARQLLRSGVNPAVKRGSPQLAGASTFEAAARAWWEAKRAGWSAAHAGDVLAKMERHVFPAIGAAALGEIDAPAVLDVLRSVEQSGAVETARRLRLWIAGVFRRAIAEKRVSDNPAVGIEEGLAERPASRRHAALLELGEIRAAYAALGACKAPLAARLAAQLVALTGVRCASARGALWGEFEGLGGAEPMWRIPAWRMKLKRSRKSDTANDHLVPLSTQAVALLRRARVDGGGSGWVFPAEPGCDWPIGENAIYAAHRAAGLTGRHSPHGWRASFSTILNEERPGERGSIDLALAHMLKDKVEAAYNRSAGRAAELRRRRALMQIWANLLVPAQLLEAGVSC